MTGRLRRHAVGVAFASAWLALILAVAAGSGVLDQAGERIDVAWEGLRNPEGERQHADDPMAAVVHGVSGALAGTWRAVRLPILLALLIGVGSVASRTAHRSRRAGQMRRFEIRLGREDLASPFKREKLFDAWHGQVSVRWWQRFVSGQPSLALELHHGRDGTQRLVLAAVGDSAQMLEGRLAETYPDVRLVPLPGAPDWAAWVVRLKKRRPFIERLQTLKNDEQTLIESLVSTMAAAREPSTVQLVLTPAPRACHRLARSLIKRKERELTHTERQVRDDIGVDSVVEDKELKGALESQHRSLYFAEIRIASDSKQMARTLAGVLSEARAENALCMREPHLRRQLYRRRVANAAANPLPSWWRGVLSSSELGAFWALPRQRVRGAQVLRSPVRRAPASPEVCRDPQLALMRDEHAEVGLWPEDRKYGLALIGGQGTGKTSAMARTIAIDAQDREAALVVLDPKHDLAQHALDLIPDYRTCWYMDLAHPEVGIDPLGVGAAPGVVADMLVAALKDAHAEGAIMAASDRFLRHAAMAVCAVEERPTLWHMLELLSPRREGYRERVAERLAARPEHAALLRYWGTTFPELWQDATRGQLGMALDAPRNKLERLITTIEVDKALRHPFAIDLRRVIQNREVLIVNGSLGEVGQDNAVTVMQLVLQLLHQALKQQQLLPPEQRSRVCLKVDEAHLVLTTTFAELLALHRAAGLEVVAAWQYNAQLQDGVIRSGLRSLLRSVSMFAMGEVRDARDQAEIAMEVYTDSIKTEREDQERLRLSPDDIVRLPVHTAVNSWVARGARRSAFVARTFAMEDAGQGARRDHHIDRQRAAGAAYPTDLLPPAEVAPTGDAAAPSTAIDPEPAPRTMRPGSDESRKRGGKRSRKSPPPPDHEDGEGAPPSYQAVHRGGVVGIAWDRRPPDPDARRTLEPTNKDLEVLAALVRYRVLLTSQIAAEWWPGNHPTAAQRRLGLLTRAGLVRRFRPTLSRGKHEWIYQVTREGFLLARRHRGADGPLVPTHTDVDDKAPNDARLVFHDLQVNAWVLAYRRLARDAVPEWRGPAESAIEAPTKAGRRAEPMGLSDLRLEGYLQVRGLKRPRFARVSPDAALVLSLPDDRQVELLVELDRTRRPTKNDSKLLRYDALITAWWRAVPRYQELGEPPVVVFVCQHDDDARQLMHLANSQLRGCIQNPGEPSARWRYPGRERAIFVSERDIHERSPRAWMLSAAPGEWRTDGTSFREVQLPILASTPDPS